ncbi:hypothetical protein HUU05_20940 [candidate division KSB1 bacterium]|nr:hypothetical protein [candidate division KSB1 bacterium]
MISDLSSSVELANDCASRFTPYLPSSEEKILVQERLQSQNALVTLWRECTAYAGEPNAVFKRGQVIEFVLDCAAANFFTELKSPYTIELISFDLRTQNPQPLYSFQEYGHLTAEYFRVIFQAPALVAGIFRLQSILLIDNSEHFSIPMGVNFVVL